MKERFGDAIEITYHNISDPKELALLLSLEKEYSLLGGGVPEIFLPTRALSGADAIRQNLDNTIAEILETRTPIKRKEVTADFSIILDRFYALGPAVVVIAGFADGINPCAFTTLIFFVSFLVLYSYSKKRILLIGAIFVTTVFLTYFLLGLGGISFLGRIERLALLPIIVKYAVAGFSGALSLLALYDFVIYKKTGRTEGLKLQLPAAIKNTMHKLIASSYRKQKHASALFFYLGFITIIAGISISALETLCTGQIYLPVITFVMRIPNLRIHAILYLFLYNGAFILPLLIIFFLAYKGVSSQRFEIFTKRHLAGIKIFYAFLFFALAASLVLF